MTHSMTISQFAQAGGVGVETVRFYHRRGLLPLPKLKQEDSCRRYDDALLRQLRFIRHAQLGGFTLEEIKKLLQSDPLTDRQNIQEMAKKRLAQLTSHIDQLIHIRNALEQMIQHCEESHLEAPCPIVQALLAE